VSRDSDPARTRNPMDRAPGAAPEASAPTARGRTRDGEVAAPDTVPAPDATPDAAARPGGAGAPGEPDPAARRAPDGVVGPLPQAQPADGSSGAIAWWATVLLLIAAGTMLVSFLFARAYLVGTGEREPPLLPALVAGGLLLAGAVAARWAHRLVRRGSDRQRAAAGMAVAFVLGAVHAAVLGVSHAGLGLDITGSIDDATFMVVAAFHYGLLLTVLGALAVSALSLVGSRPLARPRIFAQVAVALWQALVVTWVVVFVILYVLPRLS
jgi:heme/copper-type cytochrome/quinol oxidase subunit 3